MNLLIYILFLKNLMKMFFFYDKIINPILKNKLNGDYIDYFNKNHDNKLIINNVKELIKTIMNLKKNLKLNEINELNTFENNNIEENIQI
jgi:hypothetical protein